MDAARAALAAATAAPLRPQAARPRKATVAPAPVAELVVAGPSPGRLREAERAVSTAERQVASAQDEHDRVLAEQQQAADPAEYDGQVAAAEEALTLAREQLAGDRRALAQLRAEARRAAAARPAPVTRVTTRAPSAPSAPRPTPDRAPLDERLADALAVQAAHLAARRSDLERARAGGCITR